MKHSNKITAPLSQGEVSSLRENPQGFSWQSTRSLSKGESTAQSSLRGSGKSTTSQNTTPSLRDSAQKRGIVAKQGEAEVSLVMTNTLSY